MRKLDDRIRRPASGARRWQPAMTTVVLAVIAVAAVVLYAALHASDVPRGTVRVIDIEPRTHHLGDDYRDDFPTAKEAEGAQFGGTFQVTNLPKRATLTIQSADVDIPDCEVWVNRDHVANLTSGTDWHTDTFAVPRGVLREGQNTIMVRTKVAAKIQLEDVLFRGAKIELQY